MPQMYFRAFRTRGVYAHWPAFRAEIRKAFHDTVEPGVIKACQDRVSYWKAIPDFAAHHRMGAKGVSVYVRPTGPVAKIWTWHVEGVKGRTITPRVKYKVRMRQIRVTGRKRRGYRAALRFKGRGGRKVFRYSVEWTGISPRPYPQDAAETYRPTFVRVMEDACRRGVAAAKREGK